MIKSLVWMVVVSSTLYAQLPGNKADRLEWFRDQGFGLFIHWRLDSQLGSVISHSMVGATDDYVNRFINDLPKTFNPQKYHPQDWAALAKLAGIRYVVFTTKHHAGFCMYDTKTTDYNIVRTPFRRDIVAELVTAFREQGIAWRPPHEPVHRDITDHGRCRCVHRGLVSSTKKLRSLRRGKMPSLTGTNWQSYSWRNHQSAMRRALEGVHLTDKFGGLAEGRSQDQGEVARRSDYELADGEYPLLSRVGVEVESAAGEGVGGVRAEKARSDRQLHGRPFPPSG